MANWSSITPFDEGEPLDAATLNRPITELQQRTDWLRQQFTMPFATVLIPVVAGEGISTGDVVYLNVDGGCTKARAVCDGDDPYEVYKSAYAVGIYDGGTGKVVVAGEFDYPSGALASLVQSGEDLPNDSAAHVYYLSSREAGKLTRFPNGPKITIGTFFDTKAIITPQYRNLAEAHVHRSALLATTEGVSGITEGWIASTDPIYTLEYQFDPESVLYAFFPPVPAQAATIVRDGLEVPPSEYVITNETIRFKSGTAWNPLTATTLVMHWVRGISGDTGPVTSLTSKPDSGIKIVACGTDTPASTGDLEAKLDFDGQSGGTPNESGWIVYKTFRDGKFRRGLVVEKISGGMGIDVTHDVDSGDAPEGQGRLVISATDMVSGEFDTIALQNAKQEMIGLFPYIKLPKYNASVPSAFTAKFQVPLWGQPTPTQYDTAYKVLFYITAFGTTGVNTSSSNYMLGLVCNTLPDFYGYASGSIPSGLAEDTADISIPFSAGYAGYDPILITNDTDYSSSDNNIVYVNFSLEKSVHPGYQVAMQFKSLEGGTYDGALGFLNLSWKIRPVDD